MFVFDSVSFSSSSFSYYYYYYYSPSPFLLFILPLFPCLLDELTMRGFVGHLEEGSFLPHHHKTFLWTHLHFSFSYNDQQIIEANVSTTGATPLSLDEIEGPLKVTFTYSTTWTSTK